MNEFLRLPPRGRNMPVVEVLDKRSTICLAYDIRDGVPTAADLQTSYEAILFRRQPFITTPKAA